ncbi:unnamed protein product [Pseudo-nitzschia multistriata]|uniref:Uncharacterized protein n=1 Tax=Pseudo-nitzschia multistriata TaxID=183589 RepID=A0A448Z6G2_9STRA|nr:unnamed protein product [Pseudo-nitzschia multistriata]
MASRFRKLRRERWNQMIMPTVPNTNIPDEIRVTSENKWPSAESSRDHAAIATTNKTRHAVSKNRHSDNRDSSALALALVFSSCSSSRCCSSSSRTSISLLRCHKKTPQQKKAQASVWDALGSSNIPHKSDPKIGASSAP